MAKVKKNNNLSEEIKELIEDAEAGDAGSQYCLAEKYMNGEDGLPEDDLKAVYWFIKSGEQGDVSAIELLIGYLDDNLILRDKVINLLLEATDNEASYGGVWACETLSYFYFNGRYVKKNINKGIDMLLKAFEIGDDAGDINILADSLYEQKYYKLSIDYYRKFLELTGGIYKDDIIILADKLYNQKYYKASADHYRKHIELIEESFIKK